MEETIKKNLYREKYKFELLPLESVLTFLKALGYTIAEYEDGHWQGPKRDEEWVVCIRLCAIKGNEKPYPYNNEIVNVFRKEFENSLLKLLLHSTTLKYDSTF